MLGCSMARSAGVGAHSENMGPSWKRPTASQSVLAMPQTLAEPILPTKYMAQVFKVNKKGICIL